MSPISLADLRDDDLERLGELAERPVVHAGSPRLWAAIGEAVEREQRARADGLEHVSLVLPAEMGALELAVGCLDVAACVEHCRVKRSREAELFLTAIGLQLSARACGEDAVLPH